MPADLSEARGRSCEGKKKKTQKNAHLIFPKHKRLIPLFFSEIRIRGGNIIKGKVKLVFEESRLESKIRYSDPEVTLIRDNKKMSDVCVQDRKCAFRAEGEEGKKKPHPFPLLYREELVPRGRENSTRPDSCRQKRG